MYSWKWQLLIADKTWYNTTISQQSELLTKRRGEWIYVQLESTVVSSESSLLLYFLCENSHVQYLSNRFCSVGSKFRRPEGPRAQGAQVSTQGPRSHQAWIALSLHASARMDRSVWGEHYMFRWSVWYILTCLDDFDDLFNICLMSSDLFECLNEFTSVWICVKYLKTLDFSVKQKEIDLDIFWSPRPSDLVVLQSA